MPEHYDERHWIKINRVPVLTLWAAVVAERLGSDEDEALTFGRAAAGLNAYSEGVAFGLFEPTPESVKKQRRELRKVQPIKVDLQGRAVLTVQTPDGLRAVTKDRPTKSESVRKYLEGKFGEGFDDARGAMTGLAGSLNCPELSRRAFQHYGKFRPQIPKG